MMEKYRDPFLTQSSSEERISGWNGPIIHHPLQSIQPNSPIFRLLCKDVYLHYKYTDTNNLGRVDRSMATTV